MIIHKSKNPLHLQLYKFADTTGLVHTNFCQYSRKVFYGAFWACVVVLCGVGVSLAVLEPLLATVMWIFSSYPFQTFFDPEWAGIYWFIDIMIFLCITVALIGTGIKKGWRKLRSLPNATPKEAGFVGTWIKSIHSKTCFTIEIKD